MAVIEGRSFEYTPTWVVALVCFIIVFISVAAERGLNRLGKFFERKDQDALYGALQKLKEELMLLGFISLLLTVFQGLITHICLPDNLANIMLPCKPETAHHARRLLAEKEDEGHCSEGYVPFLSMEALHQLHIFIFVLAVVYVVFCALTMVLGGIKISQWTHWENSMEAGQPRAHPHHIQDFLKRKGTYWRKFRVVSWVAAFLKQFYGSVTKSDYLALRSGFILKHCPHNPKYNFHRYLLRTLEKDFKKIVGISWYLWLFVVLFLLMNLAGWHPYFWLSFLPLILLLIVGAKLEHIITELAQRTELANDRPGGVEGTQIRPSDKLFWFGRPGLVLYLIHFILFQNSFEIAFFLWIWVTYGHKSCIMEELAFIIPRVLVGIIVQLMCSYSTLPLYALVSQMGNMFKQTIFDESTQGLVMDWVKDRSSHRGSMNRLTSETGDSVTLAQLPAAEEEITATETEHSGLEISQMPSWNHC